ncbi:MAG: cytochrome-c peroxidase [Gemmatimonadaceae bacterium]
MMLSVERLCRVAVIAGLSCAVACYDQRSPSEPLVEPSLDAQLRASLQGWGLVLPIADVSRQNRPLVELGRALFFDKELSGNRDISCGTCHDPVTHGGDSLSLAIGTGSHGATQSRQPGSGRQFVPRNTPSMLNQALTFPYMFWDGRLQDRSPIRTPDSTSHIVFPAGLDNGLAAQAMLPVLNRIEMRGERGDRDRFGNVNELAAISDVATNDVWNGVMSRLLRVSGYQAMFSAAFPGVPATALGFQHAANAIAAFEIDAFTRTNSPFDRFLKRDTRSMSDEAKRGAILFFTQARCAQCHNGPALGGQQFANIGIPQIGPGVGKSAPLDIGRGEIFPVPGLPPQQPSPYRFSFRVAPLRNVELTAPYMHNGAYPKLEAVVRHYTNPDSALKAYDVTQIAPELRGSHHGEASTIAAILQTLDFRVRTPIRLTTVQQQEILAFLKSLTDPAARDLSLIAPAQVPSGLPVRE